METLRRGDEVADFPPDKVEGAIAAGFVPMTKEEVQAYDEAKAYRESTTAVGRMARAGAVGAASGALSLPAFASNVLPGVEGQSGHSWVANSLAAVTGETDEEVERNIRTIAETSPGAHMAGEIAGSLVGSYGAGAAAKLGLKAATKAGGKAAAAASAIAESPNAIQASIVGENAVSGMAMTNDEAWVQNREMTAEMAAVSGALGGIGPLGVMVAGRAVKKVGRAAATKLDKARIQSHAREVRAHEKAVSEAAETRASAEAQRARKVADIDAKYQAAMEKHQAKVADLDAAHAEALGKHNEKVQSAVKKRYKKVKADYEKTIKSMVKEEADNIRALRKAEAVHEKGVENKLGIMRKRKERFDAEVAGWGNSYPKSLYDSRDEWLAAIEKRIDNELPYKTPKAAKPKLDAQELAEIEKGVRERHPFRIDDLSPGLKRPVRKADPKAPVRKEYPPEVGAVKARASDATKAKFADAGKDYDQIIRELADEELALRRSLKEADRAGGRASDASKAAFLELKRGRGGRTAKLRKELGLSGKQLKEVRRDIRAFAKEPNAIPDAPDAPNLFADLFDPEKRMRAASGLLSEAETSFESAAKGAIRGAASASKYAVRRGVARSFWSRGASTGALVGSLVTGDLLGALLGSGAAAVVGRYGMAASGVLFKQMSKTVGSLAKQAAIKAESGAGRRHLSPLVAGVAGINRAKNQAYVDTMFDEVTNTVDSTLNNPVGFADSMGDFGELNGANRHAVSAVTTQNLKAIQYLKEEQPQRKPLYPGMPQLGMTDVGRGEKEIYLRKARAVMNPLTILDDLANGNLTKDAVEAVQTVYPALYLNMQSEVLGALNSRTKPLDRLAAMNIDRFLGSNGAVYSAATPQYMARMHMMSEAAKAMGNSGAGQPKRTGTQNRGRQKGNPTTAQQMATTSQRLDKTQGNY